MAILFPDLGISLSLSIPRIFPVRRESLSSITLTSDSRIPHSSMNSVSSLTPTGKMHVPPSSSGMNPLIMNSITWNPEVLDLHSSDVERVMKHGLRNGASRSFIISMAAVLLPPIGPDMSLNPMNPTSRSGESPTSSLMGPVSSLPKRLNATGRTLANSLMDSATLASAGKVSDG